MTFESFWGQTVFAELHEEVDPVGDLNRFRPLNRAYTGDTTFWRVPSPEPVLTDEFWARVEGHLEDERLSAAAWRLTEAVSAWESDGNRLVLAAILRAGVPVADWLARLMPGAVTAALSLFVGLGMDSVALAELKRRHPDRRILFVDGWTGKGGVARAIRSLNEGPLAVLIDPWGWADFSGAREDLFCPAACFTGLATLGFSRTFHVASDRMFGAYRFPERYWRPGLVKAWQRLAPSRDPRLPIESPQPRRFSAETPVRLHSNEVCRALINAAPKTLYFRDGTEFVENEFPLLLALAEQRRVPVVFDRTDLASLNTRVACTLDIAGT